MKGLAIRWTDIPASAEIRKMHEPHRREQAPAHFTILKVPAAFFFEGAPTPDWHRKGSKGAPSPLMWATISRPQTDSPSPRHLCRSRTPSLGDAWSCWSRWRP